jgi:hypothetical protein
VKLTKYKNNRTSQNQDQHIRHFELSKSPDYILCHLLNLPQSNNKTPSPPRTRFISGESRLNSADDPAVCLTGAEEVVEVVVLVLDFVDVVAVVEDFVDELVLVELAPSVCPTPPSPDSEEDVDVFEVELVVLVAEVVECVDAAAVVAAGGRMTLKLTVASHSSRVKPMSQQPPSVQYSPASQ